MLIGIWSFNKRDIAFERTFPECSKNVPCRYQLLRSMTYNQACRHSASCHGFLLTSSLNIWFWFQEKKEILCSSACLKSISILDLNWQFWWVYSPAVYSAPSFLCDYKHKISKKWPSFRICKTECNVLDATVYFRMHFWCASNTKSIQFPARFLHFPSLKLH